jgi:hypothetical protein
VAVHREIEGTEPIRPDPVERLAGRRAQRQAKAAWQDLATGTLACPACDAPILLDSGPASPRDSISCGFCLHVGVVRDFLSLAEPTRPTRVVVRLRVPAFR